MYHIYTYIYIYRKLQEILDKKALVADKKPLS